MRQWIRNNYSHFIEALWIVAWIGLPFTSFPILGWATNSQAAPLAAIPFGVLLFLWFIPHVIRKNELPKEVLPILGFMMAAIVSSAAIYYMDVVHFENRTYFDQSARAIFTLSIGLLFYLVTSAWLRDSIAFRRALQWIHIGGAGMLLWGLLQAFIIFTMNGHFPAQLDNIRTWLVIQNNAVREGARLTSLAYEPSWFAHQLNMLYLPLWLAATYLKQSVFRVRILRLSIENILLAFGLVEFFLSRPRVGLAAFLLVIAFLFIKANITLGKTIGKSLIKRLQLRDTRRKFIAVIINISISLFLTVLYIGLAWLLIYMGAKFDERLALLFNPIPKADLAIIMAMDENTLIYFGIQLRFLERVIYWLFGWYIFNDYPILGIGLGNTGFFASEYLHSVSWSSTEFRDLIFRLGFMINTKSFWIRILAETGLVGFSLFVTWLVGLWRSAVFLLSSSDSLFRLIGLAGQLALVAFLIEGFSLDSFALPYLWIIAGIITAGRYSQTYSTALNT
jgi:hypothetical protein